MAVIIKKIEDRDKKKRQISKFLPLCNLLKV